MSDATTTPARVPDYAVPSPDCPHARVHPYLPALRQGASDRTSPHGYHADQRGKCDRCERPMRRLVDFPPHGRVRASPWEAVPGVPPKRRAA